MVFMSLASTVRSKPGVALSAATSCRPILRDQPNNRDRLTGRRHLGNATSGFSAQLEISTKYQNRLFGVLASMLDSHSCSRIQINTNQTVKHKIIVKGTPGLIIG